MKINWFPGHMTKALRTMEQEIKTIDFVIYVLDARAPKSSVNPKFQELIGNKPIIYILNKIDLADEKITDEFKSYFTNKNSICLALNCTQSGIISKIDAAAKTLCAPKIEKYKTKGLNAILRCMVLGVPNSGKSTLVNNLCGVGRAVTGNKPGVTKGKQWVRVTPTFEVLDTPGTLWPSFSDEWQGEDLALVGSIKDEVFDVGELALVLIEKLQKLYPNALSLRYNIQTQNKTALEIYEDIASAKKFMLKGGEIDYERTAKMIVDDFRKTRLGKITLERI
ncbi:MAG: ribosome biogenesis GTPase YlqF [Christensenellales bacterium]